MAALDVVGALANVKTMLSELTAWQAICGVSSSSEAAKYIYEGGVEGIDGGSVVPAIVLEITSFPATWKASQFHGELAIDIRFYLEAPEANRETASSQYVWAWAQYSAMLAGIAGAVGGSGQQMANMLNTPLMPAMIDPNENGGRNEWNFILSLTGVVI